MAAYATFVQAGTIDYGVGSTINPAYPGSGIVAGDLLIMQVISNQSGGSVGGIDAVAGWTLLYGGVFQDNSHVPVGVAALYYKTADGTETGTVAVSRTGSTGSSFSFGAMMYQFTSTKKPIKIETSSVNSPDGSTPASWSGVTVGGVNRTLVALYQAPVSSSPGTPTGYSLNDSQTISSGAVDLCLDCSDNEDVSSDGIVNAGAAPSQGWVAFHLCLFAPKGRSFVVN